MHSSSHSPILRMKCIHKLLEISRFICKWATEMYDFKLPIMEQSLVEAWIVVCAQQKHKSCIKIRTGVFKKVDADNCPDLEKVIQRETFELNFNLNT
jgi:hypothetical protein